ncbi:MAG: 30S ribosomal protein S17 [Planctomycetota bacterium]
MMSGNRRMMRGVVISNKMQKTIVVRVQRLVMHPKYKKYMRHYSKFFAHDELESAKEGDTVEIVATRPLSKKKNWRLVEIVSTQHSD